MLIDIHVAQEKQEVLVNNFYSVGSLVSAKEFPKARLIEEKLYELYLTYSH